MVHKINRLGILLFACVLIGSATGFRAAASDHVVTGPVVLPTPPAASVATVKSEEKNLAFKGISVGMTADDVRKKLGDPKEKGDAQDLYIFSDNASGQVFYNGQRAVTAISFDYSAKSGAPTARDVLGVDVEAAADGAMYKMIRFPKAGYWISYSRTAGNDGLVSITMQKIP